MGTSPQQASSPIVLQGGPGGRQRWGGLAQARLLTLPVKTTIGVLTLLVTSVAICGLVFLLLTRALLHEDRQTQALQFAYGAAAMLNVTGAQELQLQLEQLKKTPNLSFALFTDKDFLPVAAFNPGDAALQAYRREIDRLGAHVISDVRQVRQIPIAGRLYHVVTVPVIRSFAAGASDGARGGEAGPSTAPAHRTLLLGYLHVGFEDDAGGQIRYLQGFLLLTCMAVVLVAIPIAMFIARHITVPIQTLAHAAHVLASGELGHRVSLLRSDELGELADAFNAMAHTVQNQQEDIKQINASLEAKVHERTAELEKLNARLKAEMAEKEDFLRAVSHDLNAPLRNISGMASMLMMKYQATLEKDAVSRLERIQKNVEVECELINELLELSRIKTRRDKIEPVNLEELARAVGEQFASDLETKAISFRVLDRLPVMHGEKARLRQVFQNLVDNAIKYMRQDGGPKEIGIRCARQGDEVVFRFSDTGMGIAPEDLPQLFHVFRRARNASVMKIPGKGVGLASVKSIIENYGGRIWVESVQGMGTTFFVAIPQKYFEVPAAVQGQPQEASV